MKTLSPLLIVCLCAPSLFAQSSLVTQDMLQKSTGEELKGRVTQVSDTVVGFRYPGETAEYRFKKADIQQIIYVSGRVERFNQPVQERQQDAVALAATAIAHHNKIAVLPFSYRVEGQTSAEQVGLRAQEDAYITLAQHTPGYLLLGPRTTNALLAESGLALDRLTASPMQEICDVLGVEYVLDGYVLLHRRASPGTRGAVTSQRANAAKRAGTTGTLPSHKKVTEGYEISASIQLYTESNALIYSASHQDFFTSVPGSYASDLDGLLKSSPLYRK